MKALNFAMTAVIVCIAAPAAAQTMTPRDYVMQAGASDLYERTSSQLVRQSSDAKVRDFAQMMIAHHTKSTADVTAAARKSGLRPMPPKLNAEQSRMVAELRAARGTARDQLYVTQQKMAHEKALALHQNYSTGGTAQPLKAAATKVVPVVQSHIDRLRTM